MQRRQKYSEILPLCFLKEETTTTKSPSQLQANIKKKDIAYALMRVLKRQRPHVVFSRIHTYRWIFTT
jgi:hypothetical protein